MATELTNANQLSHFQQPVFDVERLLERIGEKINESLKQQEVLPKAIYNTVEAVAVTGMSLSTILRAENAGRLKGRWEGRKRYYLGQDLLDWLARNEEGGGER